jgi:hypothetical protein
MKCGILGLREKENVKRALEVAVAGHHNLIMLYKVLYVSYSNSPDYLDLINSMS